MGWKNLPYWFKGGLIGLIIPSIYWVYMIIKEFVLFQELELNSLVIYFWTLTAIPFILVGLLIGLIIDKFKSRNFKKWKRN